MAGNNETAQRVPDRGDMTTTEVPAVEAVTAPVENSIDQSWPSHTGCHGRISPGKYPTKDPDVRRDTPADSGYVLTGRVRKGIPEVEAVAAAKPDPDGVEGGFFQFGNTIISTRVIDGGSYGFDASKPGVAEVHLPGNKTVWVDLSAVPPDLPEQLRKSGAGPEEMWTRLAHDYPAKPGDNSTVRLRKEGDMLVPVEKAPNVERLIAALNKRLQEAGGLADDINNALRVQNSSAADTFELKAALQEAKADYRKANANAETWNRTYRITQTELAKSKKDLETAITNCQGLFSARLQLAAAVEDLREARLEVAMIDQQSAPHDWWGWWLLNAGPAAGFVLGICLDASEVGLLRHVAWISGVMGMLLVIALGVSMSSAKRRARQAEDRLCQALSDVEKSYSDVTRALQTIPEWPEGAPSPGLSA